MRLCQPPRPADGWWVGGCRSGDSPYWGGGGAVDPHPGWLMAFFVLTEGQSGWGRGRGHSFPINGCFETPLMRCRCRERGCVGRLGPGPGPGISLGLGLGIYIYCALPAMKLYPIPSIMGLRGRACLGGPWGRGLGFSAFWLLGCDASLVVSLSGVMFFLAPVMGWKWM